MKGSRRRFTIQAIVWLVVMVAAIIFLPNISSLVRDKGQTKLPSSAKSQVAQVIQNHWGRNQNNTRQVVVVFNNGDSPLTSDQKQAIDGTIQRFKVQKSKYHVKSMTAASDNAAAKKQLISKDKSTQLLQLMVGKNQTVANMTKNITAGAKTAGVKTYVTGSDILNDDFTQETEAGIQKTEIITVIFIFIVLTLVFRSPITPLVSLLSVGVSFIISLSVVMNLVNKFNFPLSNFTQVFMVVVLFGIGTDYNILLFDQFKEELSHGDSPVAATGRALKIAGRTILYSGSSLLIGFSALGLANFSIYKSAVGVAIAVAILLLVLLTLNPFFMALLGPRLFWPTKKFAGGSTSKMWHGIAASSVRYPIIALVVVLGVSLPFILTYNNELNYDTLAELNDTIPAKKGFQVVQDHFSKGTAEPSTLYIKTDHALNNEKDLKVIDSLTKQLQKVKGVKTVASVTQPGGSQIDQLYVGNQLGTVTSGMKSASKGLTKIGSGLDSANSKLKSANMSDSAKSAKKLADGADEVASGVVSYTDGVYTVNNGLNQLNSKTGTLSSGVNQLVSGSGQVTSGAKTVASGNSTLATNLVTYTNGVYTVNSGLNQLNSKTGTLSSGVNKLATGANSLSSGLTTVFSGTQSLSNGLSELNNKKTSISSGTTQLTTSISALQQGSATLSENLAALEKEVSSSNSAIDTSELQTLTDQLKKINTNLQTVADSPNNVSTNISSVEKAASAFSASNEDISNDMVTMKSALSSAASRDAASSSTTASVNANSVASAALAAAGSSATSEQKAAISSAVTSEVNAQNSSNASTSSTATTNAGTVTASDGLTALADMQQKLSTLKEASSSLDDLSSNLNNLASVQQVASAAIKGNQASLQAIQQISQAAAKMQQMEAAVAKLSSGSSELTNNLSKLQTGANTLATSLNQYTAGVATASAGASKLNTGVSSASTGASQLSSGLGSLQGQIPTLTSAISVLDAGTNKLTNNSAALVSGANQLASGANQVASGSSQVTTGLTTLKGQVPTLVSAISALDAGTNKLVANSATLNSGASQVASGNEQMYTSIQSLVGQMQTLQDGLKTASDGTKTINTGVGSANSYLTGLKDSAAAKTYYVPKSTLKGKTYKSALKAYMSGNNHATKLTIVLNENPSSKSAMDKVTAIQKQATNSLKGTALDGATIAIGGQTSETNDTQAIASSDFVRTAAIMLVGILIALMVITRSVLQPFYILGTLLLAYIMSLSITRILSNWFLGQSMLTWNTPFFGFIMLIALGVDYSIFLMMKYREFDNSAATPSTRIVRASAVIGAVVLSAALILSGTFAALMPSGVLTLIQVAMVVIIGLIILVFAIPTIIPSLIRLTYPLTDRMEDETTAEKQTKRNRQ
ncbi:MMPL family transporter [Lactiplantibacillus plantarum]|uniref:MMPL family transporter n=1 Tax=Lactiplantibacillus plantarum TaxID=1590 RepID=UPI00137BDBE2|nr:MMPL family transporter [Lactiplantibacillus plantarum]MBO2711010.1 MMPL family transporter [Lactiplantibacillus plantarum]MCG0569271.1 transport protein, MMPL family [Lactiplantibacillus plantarum]MCG0615636.1 transport protein, MMPL family [Lactiplantibacillus plantarum]MCG0653756.1 transport protein, MMPL family [Lactiplantibacillus plantarum]MCG0711359.1 transport protein, MMPL family [Lactiplantibacillus plantarum]